MHLTCTDCGCHSPDVPLETVAAHNERPEKALEVVAELNGWRQLVKDKWICAECAGTTKQTERMAQKLDEMGE